MTNTTFKLEEVELKNDKYPRPTGHRILIKTLDIANKTNMGIYLPTKSIEDHRAIASIGKVIELGEDAYKREDMTSPWCKLEITSCSENMLDTVSNTTSRITNHER